MRSEKIFIKHSHRNYFEMAVASGFYVGAVMFIYLGTTHILENPSEHPDLTPYLLSGVFFFLALRYSVGSGYQIDFSRNSYRELFYVGFLKVGRSKKFKSIDYISVFKTSDDMYRINMWYNENKHISLAMQYEYINALKEAKELAKMLDVKLLDAASDPQDSKWVKLS